MEICWHTYEHKPSILFCLPRHNHDCTIQLSRYLYPHCAKWLRKLRNSLYVLHEIAETYTFKFLINMSASHSSYMMYISLMELFCFKHLTFGICVQCNCLLVMFDVRGSVHRSKMHKEKSYKMQQCFVFKTRYRLFLQSFLVALSAPPDIFKETNLKICSFLSHLFQFIMYSPS